MSSTFLSHGARAAFATIVLFASASLAGAGCSSSADGDEADEQDVASDDAALTGGSGLLGQYFDRADLRSLVTSRIDPQVDFTWHGVPAPGVAANTFSVKWTGQVKARYSEDYTFHLRSNDGARLWVDGDLIINDWKAHHTHERRGEIHLRAGHRYDIKVEMFDKSGTGVVELRWSSHRTKKQLVPTGRLFPPAAPPPPDGGVVDADGGGNLPDANADGGDGGMCPIIGAGPSQIDFGTAACNTCVRTKCCAQATACFGGATDGGASDCTLRFACGANCQEPFGTQNSPCELQCDQRFTAAANQAYRAARSCIFGSPTNPNTGSCMQAGGSGAPVCSP